MKKHLLLVLFFSTVAAIQFAYTQNTFPTNGNAGIGTTSPTTTLQIIPTTGNGVLIGNTTYPSWMGNNGLYVSGTAWANNVIINGGYELAWGDSRAYIMGLSANSNSLLSFNTNALERARITYTGDFGIGTTSPGSQLDIFHSGTGTALRVGGNATGTSNDASIDLYVNNANNVPAYARVALGVNTGSVGSESGYLAFSTINSGSLTEKMRITKEGNVLIAQSTQTNSAYKLDVNGYVRANQITVNVTGADFVFNPDYKLYSLAYLDKYIHQNHHLPEIPSAKEMQTNGLNIGENQTKLLQKVEELTLYLIEKDKQLNAADEKNKQLTTHLSDLEKRLNALEQKLK